MFVTNIHYEYPQSGPRDPLGHRFWSAVEMGPQMPWFHATVEFSIGRQSATRFLLLASIEELGRTAVMRSRRASLKNVLLVSPPWLNRGPYWRMDSLKQVIVAGRNRGGESARYYHLENGEVLTEGNAPAGKLVTRKLFSMDAT